MKHLLITICFINVCVSFSQDKVKIQGRVIDEENKEPLSYVNISLQNKNIGCISNEEGDFLFTFWEDYNNDTLNFSCVGYKTTHVILADLNDTLNIIELVPAPILLSEVIIKPEAAIDIIKEAINNIPKNYLTNPYNMIGFYRELIREKQDFHKYAEGIIGVYREKGEKELIKLVKGRKRENLKAFGVHKKANPTLGGPIGCFYKDITSYEREFFNNKYLKYYDYKIDGITSINEKPVYIISFNKKPEAKKGRYKGKIFIDKLSKAIIRANYEYNEYGIRKSRPDAIQRGLAKIIVGVTFESLGSFASVNYTEINGKWYLKSVKYKIVDKLTKKKKVYIYTTEKELMISEINKEEIRKFNKEELLNTKKEFSKQIGEYDEEFWKNYNTLKVTKSQKMLIDDMDNNENK